MLYISRSLESFTEGRGLVVQSTHWKSESTFLLQSQKRSRFQVVGADLPTQAGDAQSALTAPGIPVRKLSSVCPRRQEADENHPPSQGHPRDWNLSLSKGQKKNNF